MTLAETTDIPLKPATNRGRIILEIRNLFLTGHLKPNQRLVEAELSDRLGVSRTPIREAFRELVQMGLLVGEPFKGVRVADIDMNEIRQVYEVRAELESLAAALAVERMTPDELQHLIRLNDSMRRAYLSNARCSALNDEFHLSLGQMSRNKVLADMISTLRVRIGAFRVVFHYHPNLVLESVRGHDEVITAMKERSPERSREAMYRHIILGITQTSGEL
jgi:DNA-binding GntR family transcriptional regulator